jgi:hypothetical protein
MFHRRIHHKVIETNVLPAVVDRTDWLVVFIDKHSGGMKEIHLRKLVQMLGQHLNCVACPHVVAQKKSDKLRGRLSHTGIQFVGQMPLLNLNPVDPRIPQFLL